MLPKALHRTHRGETAQGALRHAGGPPPGKISGSLPYSSRPSPADRRHAGKRSRDAPRPNAERGVSGRHGTPISTIRDWPDSTNPDYSPSSTARSATRARGICLLNKVDCAAGWLPFPERKARAGHQGHRHRLAALPARRRARHAVEQDIRPFRHATARTSLLQRVSRIHAQKRKFSGRRRLHGARRAARSRSGKPARDDAAAVRPDRLPRPDRRRGYPRQANAPAGRTAPDRLQRRNGHGQQPSRKTPGSRRSARPPSTWRRPNGRDSSLSSRSSPTTRPGKPSIREKSMRPIRP